jgi:hypothetical protein
MLVRPATRRLGGVFEAFLELVHAEDRVLRETGGM